MDPLHILEQRIDQELESLERRYKQASEKARPVIELEEWCFETVKRWIKELSNETESNPCARQFDGAGTA